MARTPPLRWGAPPLSWSCWRSAAFSNTPIRFRRYRHRPGHYPARCVRLDGILTPNSAAALRLLSQDVLIVLDPGMAGVLIGRTEARPDRLEEAVVNLRVVVPAQF